MFAGGAVTIQTVPPVRAVRKPPSGAPSELHPAELSGPREHLDRLRIHHLDLTSRFLAAAGELFSIDLFMAAAMTRSYSLVDGFLSAFDTWNPIVAAPLVRMQIDSLVRTSYLVRAPSATDVADYVLRGGEFRKLKDSSGKVLHDARLMELATEHHPWASPVYKATSGWVHFSPEHVRATWRIDTQSDGRRHISGELPMRASSIGLKPMAELIGAMTKATSELFGYVEIWEDRKGVPVGRLRSKEDSTAGS